MGGKTPSPCAVRAHTLAWAGLCSPQPENDPAEARCPPLPPTQEKSLGLTSDILEGHIRGTVQGHCDSQVPTPGFLTWPVMRTHRTQSLLSSCPNWVSALASLVDTFLQLQPEGTGLPLSRLPSSRSARCSRLVMEPLCAADPAHASP